MALARATCQAFGRTGAVQWLRSRNVPVKRASQQGISNIHPVWFGKVLRLPFLAAVVHASRQVASPVLGLPHKGRGVILR